MVMFKYPVLPFLSKFSSENNNSLFKVRLLLSKKKQQKKQTKNKMIKNVFYFILKALFVKTPKFLP